MSFKVPGLAASKGREEFKPLPPAEYLLKVTEIETENKTDDSNNVIGMNFIVSSVVENAENLPGDMEKGEVVGKVLKEWIYIMGEDHPRYSEATKYGGTLGQIGVDQLKSFLNAVKIPVKADGFNEKTCVGKYYEATLELDTYKGNDGKEKVSNSVKAYRVAEEAGGAVAVEADADIPEDFEGDLA